MAIHIYIANKRGLACSSLRTTSARHELRISAYAPSPHEPWQHTMHMHSPDFPHI